MKAFAVIRYREEDLRQAHIVYANGTKEAFGYPQQNSGPVVDIRRPTPPVDVWWADSQKEAEGLQNGLTAANPGTTFIVVQSKIVVTSMVEKTTLHKSTFTDQGLLPS